MDKQLKENAGKSASALNKLTLVQGKVKARKALVAESDVIISKLNRQIDVCQKEMDKAKSQLDTMTLYFGRMVKSAYKNRDARKWYMYILASDNLSQGMRRYGYFRNISTQMNTQAKAIQRLRDSLDVEKARLVSLRGEEARVREQRQKDVNKLVSEEKEAKALTAKLKKEKSKYQKELSNKKNQAVALEKEIKKAIGGAKKPGKPVDYTLAKDFVANKGKLPWPVSGSVVAHFGKQFHPVFKSLKLPDNNGVTLAVPKSAKVKAVFNGEVAQITVLPGYHQCVLVQDVKRGERVKTGQELGTVDTINGETVFHFEIWDDKTLPRDPEIWLRPLD